MYNFGVKKTHVTRCTLHVDAHDSDLLTSEEMRSRGKTPISRMGLPTIMCRYVGDRCIMPVEISAPRC